MPHDATTDHSPSAGFADTQHDERTRWHTELDDLARRLEQHPVWRQHAEMLQRTTPTHLSDLDWTLLD